MQEVSHRRPAVRAHPAVKAQHPAVRHLQSEINRLGLAERSGREAGLGDVAESASWIAGSGGKSPGALIPHPPPWEEVTPMDISGIDAS